MRVMADRADIIRKIKALMARTPARGCTEAEAEAAAAMAASLMRQYGLGALDLDMGSTLATAPSRPARWQRVLVGSIGFATNCVALWCSRSKQVEFVGATPGPDIAVYLFIVGDRAAKRAAVEFRRTEFYRKRRAASTKRKAIADFLTAFSERLSLRIMDMFADQQSAELNAAARRYLDQLYPDTKTMKAGKAPKTRFDQAAALGSAAASNVGLHRGMAQDGGAPLLIGGRR